jgi:hypothetical protein
VNGGQIVRDTARSITAFMFHDLTPWVGHVCRMT